MTSYFEVAAMCLPLLRSAQFRAGRNRKDCSSYGRKKEGKRRDQSPLGRTVQLRSVVSRDVEITGIVAGSFYREGRVLSVDSSSRRMLGRCARDPSPRWRKPGDFERTNFSNLGDL